MKLGARNLAFLWLSTSGKGWMLVKDEEREGRGPENGSREEWEPENERRGETTFFSY